MEKFALGLKSLFLDLIQHQLLLLTFLLNSNHGIVCSAGYVRLLERVSLNVVELKASELANERSIINESLTLISLVSRSRLNCFLSGQCIGIIKGGSMIKSHADSLNIVVLHIHFFLQLSHFTIQLLPLIFHHFIALWVFYQEIP